MEDLVTAIALAVGLEAVFFVLLIVLGHLEPEQPRATTQHPIRAVKKPSTAGARDATEEDDSLRAA
jgi:hypothetical protein